MVEIGLQQFLETIGIEAPHLAPGSGNHPFRGANLRRRCRPVRQARGQIGPRSAANSNRNR